MPVFGCDVSRWQIPAEINWALMKENGCVFGIAKASQGDYLTDIVCDDHLAKINDAGLIAGVYHWVDPRSLWTKQVERFLASIAGLKYDFVSLDVEQYWKDWGQYSRGQVVDVYDGLLISNICKYMANDLKQKTGKKVVIYSRAEFVKNWAPQMMSWINPYPTWSAYYPNLGSPPIRTWDQMRIKVEELLKKETYSFGSQLFWQITGGGCKLPGMGPSGIDLNVFEGTEAELRAFFGATPTIPTKEPTRDEKIDMVLKAHEHLWISK